MRPNVNMSVVYKLFLAQAVLVLLACLVWPRPEQSVAEELHGYEPIVIMACPDEEAIFLEDLGQIAEARELLAFYEAEATAQPDLEPRCGHTEDHGPGLVFHSASGTTRTLWPCFVPERISE